MCIILRLICAILNEIAVEIMFLWDSKHGLYRAAPFIAIVTSWYLRKDKRKFTSVILYMNIICIAQWLFDAKSEILHCSSAFARRHKHCKPEALSCKNVSIIFYRENMTSFLNYVTATLRTLYAWRGSYQPCLCYLDTINTNSPSHFYILQTLCESLTLNKMPLNSIPRA